MVEREKPEKQTRRLFGAMLERIRALPVAAG
jgi:hypothetical protein